MNTYLSIVLAVACGQNKNLLFHDLLDFQAHLRSNNDIILFPGSELEIKLVEVCIIRNKTPVDQQSFISDHTDIYEFYFRAQSDIHPEIKLTEVLIARNKTMAGCQSFISDHAHNNGFYFWNMTL